MSSHILTIKIEWGFFDFPPTPQGIRDNPCNPATKTYRTMIQQVTATDYLQRKWLKCNRTVADVADGFQRIYNRNALIFMCMDFRCRCVCDSI